MAEIRPFRGIRYNQQNIPDLAKVICPPYDIIDPQQQDELYDTNEFNFVKIEYNKETHQDTSEDNRYTRAASNIEKWLNQGILKYDAKPALYIYTHHFTCMEKQYLRQNIIACVRLEEWDKKMILPHENIIPKAKSDRLSMLRTCQCNTSPVLMMYEDPKRIISSLVKDVEKNNPVIDFVDTWNERHQLWMLNQMEAIREIQQVIAVQPLYIADGHHRYDSALTYKREKTAQSGNTTGEEPFNFAMTVLFDFVDPGLVILPTHRLLRGITSSAMDGLKSKLQQFFDIEEFPIDMPDVWSRVDALLTGLKPDMKQVRIAIFGLTTNMLSILTLRDRNAVNQLIPSSHGDLYKMLDVSLVDHIILDKILAFDKDKEEDALVYSHNRKEVVERVKKQQYQLAFILNPVKPEIIRGIADAGDRMPRKSTYFYPKSPSGLVFNKY